MKTGLKKKIIISISAFFLTALFLVCAAQISSADSQGPNSPGTVTNLQSPQGHGAFVWWNPDYAKISDSNYATVSFPMASSTILDENVLIVKADGSFGTANKADGANPWSTETYEAYGSSSDLWGETWTPSDINNSNFGVGISAYMTDGEDFYWAKVLTATNFGFSIPAGATINGILAEVEKKYNNYQSCVNHIRITVYYTPGSVLHTRLTGMRLKNARMK